MTQDQFLAALDTLGWTKTNLARHLGCDLKVPQRWAEGIGSIHPDVERWIEEEVKWRKRHPAPTGWKRR